VVVYLVKKIMKRARPEIDDGELIKILSVKYLSPKNSIMLVDIAGNTVALGVSNNGVSFLTRIMDSGSLERIEDMNKSRGGKMPLSDYLVSSSVKLHALLGLRGKNGARDA
jgi:flagellar biogenesis protein FliO